jgi:hypothetical protein
MKRWLFVLFLLLPGVALAEHYPLSGVDDLTPNIPLSTQLQLDDLVMTYYVAPSPDKVDTLLDLINSTHVLQKKTAWASFIGFLTVVFEKNPDHIMEWMSRNDYNTYAEDVIVSALLHARQKDNALIFARAHGWAKTDMDRLAKTQDDIDLKHLAVVLPGHIDTLWGAFFASGDPVYVQEIIDVIFLKSLPYSPNVSAPTQYNVLKESHDLAALTIRRYASFDGVIKATLKKRIETDPANKAVYLKLLTPPGAT